MIIDIVNQKELDILSEEIDELYNIYVAAYHNSLNEHDALAIAVHPEGPTFNVVGHLAQALALRGARRNWPLLTKRLFAEKMENQLSGDE
jgi:hypothetical protein